MQLAANKKSTGGLIGRLFHPLGCPNKISGRRQMSDSGLVNKLGAEPDQNGLGDLAETLCSETLRIAEIRDHVIPGAGSQQPSPRSRIRAPEIEYEIGSRAGHIFFVNGHELTVDVVINLSRFPYQFEGVRNCPVVAAHRTSLITGDTSPIRHPEGVRMVALLLKINLCRAVTVVQESGANLPAYLYRHVFCPPESAVEETIQGSGLPTHDAAQRGLCQRKADT